MSRIMELLGEKADGLMNHKCLVDKRTLSITEIPYTTTTESIKESIIKANERGKIKIKKVDDNTSDRVEIVIQVSPDESTDKTIDALYAFTDCEVSISPNACVIESEKPNFLGVSDILRRSVDYTKGLLKLELEIRLGELDEAWHAASLERIFIENKLYQLIEGKKTREEAYRAVGKGLTPFTTNLRRPVTEDDIPREMTKDQAQREQIVRALRRNNGRRKDAARDLFISERTLYRKIKELGIDGF